MKYITSQPREIQTSKNGPRFAYRDNSNYLERMEYLSKFQTRILDRLIYRDDIFDWNVVLKSTFLLPFFLDLEDTTIRRRIGKRYISRFSKTGKKKSQKGCVYMYT